MILSRINSRNRDPDRGRIFFDLTHPADYHFFKGLIELLNEKGYVIQIMARDKECLYDLLRDRGFDFIGRGKGSTTLVGKYLWAVLIVVRLLYHLVRFRPELTISLSSPYLVVSSKILKIKTLTYDDTETDHLILKFLKRSDYLFSPEHYPLKFHQRHYRLPVFKELSYLYPAFTNVPKERKDVFVRFARTDSTHHTGESGFENKDVLVRIAEIASPNEQIIFSSELPLNSPMTAGIKAGNVVHIHRDLWGCRLFWGNSTTMAAEAAIMGIPAIYISPSKLSYIRELEDHGLLFHYPPACIEKSFKKVQELLSERTDPALFISRRDALLAGKIDMTAFLEWFITHLPESQDQMEADPATHLRFRTH